MGLSYDIQRAFELWLYAFSQEVANSGYEYAYIDSNFDPDSATSIFLASTLFIDRQQRATTGRGGVRRQTGRYQVNVNAPTGNGDTNVNNIADRLIDWFDPFDTPTLTENGRTIRIGTPDNQDGLPWTVEPVTAGNWRTKPVFVPFFTDLTPS